MRKTSFLALGSLLLAACGGNVNNANQELVLNDSYQKQLPGTIQC